MAKKMNIAAVMLEQKAHLRGEREEAAAKPLRIQPDILPHQVQRFVRIRYSILLQLAFTVSNACWYIWFMFCMYSSNGIRGRLITDKVWLDICPSLTN